MSRKFYKIRYEVIVLSEEPVSDSMDLHDALEEMTTGDFSGEINGPYSEEVDGPTMAQLLLGQGSDPEFFQLDADGNDLSEQE